MMFGLSWQAWLPLWMFSPVLAAIAWSDFSRMRIPNTFGLAGLAIFLPALFYLEFDETLLRVMAAAICFAICFGLFAVGWLGGGDAKILPVMFLMVPPSVVSTYLLLLSASMALGLAAMPIVRRIMTRSKAGFESVARTREFPMGIAIGLSGLVLAGAALFDVVS